MAREQGKESFTPLLVASWIGSAYFFTSSTSFANPAVTIARAFSDTFSGIAAQSVPKFIASQLLGAAIGTLLATYVLTTRRK
ncbi:MAG: aquaporin, partial [Candidatus Planktophila sp.]|jgi:glycerol uptake facilitator-like aquaporin